MEQETPSEDSVREYARTSQSPLPEEQRWRPACPICGLVVPSGTKLCPNDGTPITNIDSGRTVPGYQFVKLLGSGGMADVYEAEHLVIKKKMAIKILKAHLMVSSALVRFQNEARAAGRLKHPNIVSVYDCGISQAGQAFMVMDLVNGETLAQLINKQGALSIEESVEIMLQICAGVICAHEQGILHRDLKPSNVMLDQTARGRSARVLDFGIAKLLDNEQGISAMTRTGELLGTPSYMSPEQANGQKLDQRSDVYALGCIFYEMLTGLPPILGNGAMDTLLKHVTEIPLPLSQAGLRKFPHSLEVVAARALAKNPSDRFQTVRDMCTDIENCQSGIPRTRKALVESKPDKMPKAKVAIPILLVFLGAVVFLCWRAVGNLSKPPESQQRSRLGLESPATAEKVKPETTTSSPAADSEKSRELVVADLAKGANMQFKDFIRSHARDLEIDAGRSGDARDYTDINDDGLTALKGLYQLRRLSLGDCSNITAEGLKNLVGLPNLQFLDLHDTNLGNEAIPQIERLHLLTLNLSRTLITNQGLLSLNKDIPLEDLNLKQDKIDDEGLKGVAGLKHLKRLCLDNCDKVTDKGIAELLHLNLEMLRLKDTGITGKVASSLLKLTNLNSLALCGTTVDDAALKQLVGLKKLLRLDLSACSRISDSAIEDFKRHSPQCQVIVDKKDNW